MRAGRYIVAYLWVLTMGADMAPAADLAEVLTLLDEPGASWDAVATDWRTEGPDSMARLLALRNVLEGKTEVDNIEARLLAHARLDRLDTLIDLVARQPHAAAGGLFWYEDVEEAQLAASKLHRPLVLLYLGPDSKPVHRLCALLYCTEPNATELRDEFVLCKVELPTGSAAVPAPVFVMADATGRPVHALKGFCSPNHFGEWLRRGREVALRVYQLSDQRATGQIQAAHQEWQDRPPVTEDADEMPLETQLLFVREEPWYRPDRSTEAFDGWEGLVDFVAECANAHGDDNVHVLFRDGIFTKTSLLLAQKMAKD